VSLVESVKAKLLSLSRARNVELTALLNRFATDRLLYRLSKSKHSDLFTLKGSLLFSAWNGDMHRPTKDVDLLGSGLHDEVTLRTMFTDICSIEASEDALKFDADSIQIGQVRDDEEYDGNRVTMNAYLGKAKIPLQVDIGFGDVVTPAAQEVELPAFLNLPAAKLKAYPPETVIAEKTEAMVKLGVGNSRMKDFYDIYWLAGENEFDGSVLSKAIYATFERRKTELTQELPFVLTEEFYLDAGKSKQWAAFCVKSKFAKLPFSEVGKRLQSFLIQPLQHAATKDFVSKWKLEKGWH